MTTTGAIVVELGGEGGDFFWSSSCCHSFLLRGLLLLPGGWGATSDRAQPCGGAQPPRTINNRLGGGRCMKTSGVYWSGVRMTRRDDKTHSQTKRKELLSYRILDK